MKDSNKIKNFISETLEEANLRNTPEELESLEEPIHHSFGSMRLSDVIKKTSELGINSNIKVKFKSEGYHKNASSLYYVEPTDGSEPYILLNL